MKQPKEKETNKQHKTHTKKEKKTRQKKHIFEYISILQ